ncbi:peptidoglycan DD-metalloendopeptidase family protein [Thiohalomonas denitrificans]|uniref:Peptidase family M23 n=1 Tax=Thiohalomonas denitrificans TaxID=415747 RepID=A0A1G5Q1K2_9GAMM|nr:peptidoglycan DD-metalloendopeptidase family protein [Thiohalomonas denitrificans]SCZ55537.1 Peptidase family M23 [Thiohalomonas denitrificans]
MTTSRIIRFILLTLMAAPLAAVALPRADLVPGGVAVIPLASSDSGKPEVTYKDRKVMVVPDNGRWTAVIGIGLSAKPGRHVVTIKRDGATATVGFRVRDKQYESQYITLKNKRQVNPYKDDLKRIRDEQTRSRKAFATWTEQEVATSRFLLPVDGVVTGTFGKRRFFNKQPRRPHSGLDLAAPTGTPVQSPAAGRVVEVGDYFFNGKVVFIDHGQGLITMFCHMDSIDVAVNDILEPGQIVGEVGATGRVTGPHLHWTVSLNDARVDPALFLSGDSVASLDGI